MRVVSSQLTVWLVPASLWLIASLPGCSRQRELQACRIAERSCQEDVYYAVVRLRGDGWDPFEGVPPIRTITADAYRDELTPDEVPEPSEPGAEPEPPAVEPWDVALRWLGLVKPTTTVPDAAIDNSVNNVAAYYAPDEQSVTVIAHDGDDLVDNRWDTVLLVHELVHAFQDNEVSAAPAGLTTDGGFAGTALIEGEARLYQDLARAEIDGVAALNWDWHAEVTGSVEWRRAQLPGSGATFYDVKWHAYDLGTDVLMDGWLRGGNAAVRALADTFPQSAVELMARYERVELDRAARLDCRVEPPEQSFELAGHDRFGAMQLYGFLTAAGGHEPDAWRTALDWRDDLLWLYFDEQSEQVALSWRIRLASVAAADAVVALAGQVPMLRAERTGNDALIVGSEAALADWPGAVDCER